MTPSLLALLLAAGLSPGTMLAVDPAHSTLRYHVVHRLHTTDAETRSVEGRAAVKADGTVQAMVRASVASFRSGDANRDSHMLETLEAGRFPMVTLRGLAHLGPGLQLPADRLPMEGEVELHGVRRPVHLELSIEQQADGALRVRATFDVSLDGFGIERPSLLFVTIDDACHVDVDLLLREERR
jgi:polyisoprenoid-binding protein YceI